MSRYRPETPSRLLTGLAVLAAGATLSLAVVLPAQLAPLDGAPFVIAGAKQVTILPGRIDVIAVKPQAAAAATGDASRTAVRREG